MAESPKVAGDSSVALTIFSNGAEIDDSYGIFSVLIRKKINAIPYARMVFQDGDSAEGDFPLSNKNTFKPGTAIKINAGYGTEQDTLFEGIVVKHGIKIASGNASRLIVEARDKSVKMTVGRKNANFEDAKDSDIIAKLIGNYSGLKTDVKVTDTQYKELVQYYCTDWDYMLARADLNGYMVIVNDGKLTIKPPDLDAKPILKVTYGEDLIDFQADMDARTQLSAVTGRTWQLKDQAIIEQEGSKPKLNKQGNLSSDDLAKVIDLKSYALQTCAPVDKTGMKTWADAQLLKAGLAKIRGKMKFQGNAKALPGSIIELNGVGERFKGNVFVSAVQHDIAGGNWTSNVEFGMDPTWFTAKDDIVAPAAGGFLPGVEGLQVGIVKKLDADPDGEHKIQVALPVMKAEHEGVWARLAGFYASDGVGAFFLPEIGDEVVLGYFNNDPCHPVILGNLYSSKNNPPYDLKAENETKALVTKSKLKIEFDDEQKVITIETPAHNKIVISDQDKVIRLADQNDNTVELSPEGIELNSPKDIKIVSRAKVSITASNGIEVKSQADVNVKGLNIDHKADMAFTAKGSASAELSASGETTVKGAMVMIN
jgi:Rhs element Vgr protein